MIPPTIEPGGVRALWSASLPAYAVGLAWLGQAGFALRAAGQRLLIDPYLSDYLAEKYRGKEFPHVRMMPAPARPDELHDLDWVLCSHRHSDHMDPGSLPILAEQNPRCRFIVPRAEVEHTVKIGLPAGRLLSVNAGDRLSLGDGLELGIVASAHEELKTNDRGEHHFLGFILRWRGITLYHSGDTLVYPGLVEHLREQRINVALLPVNGRDERRRSRGVPGNMTFDEARRLCIDAGIGWMVPHHFGLFEFNTVPVVELSAAIRATRDVRCILPDLNQWYTFSQRSHP